MYRRKSQIVKESKHALDDDERPCCSRATACNSPTDSMSVHTESDDQLMTLEEATAMDETTSAPSCHDKRFVVKKWIAQALWSWDVAVEICAICRNQIMELCIECQANPSACNDREECTVAWGMCNHAFHFHCISRWLKNRPVCPLDNQEWEYRTFGN